MFTTRRRFATLVSGSLASAGLGLPGLALAAADDPPNVFFSPHGKPFRAVARAPYPVVDWFREADRNGDGKLDPDEFVADAAAFFDVLDLNGDGSLDATEITAYEHNIAPEVLGQRVTVYADGGWAIRPGGARLWLAQYGPQEGPTSSGGLKNLPGQPGQGGNGAADESVLPGDLKPNVPPPKNPDERLVGAGPYGLTGEPEPVTAADPDYVVRGVVAKARFLDHARANFARLAPAGAGYLTLAGLPQSAVQRMLQRRG